MGPAQINGYYNPQQNRIGMWEFPVRGRHVVVEVG